MLIMIIFQTSVRLIGLLDRTWVIASSVLLVASSAATDRMRKGYNETNSNKILIAILVGKTASS